MALCRSLTYTVSKDICNIRRFDKVLFEFHVKLEVIFYRYEMCWMTFSVVIVLLIFILVFFGCEICEPIGRKDLNSRVFALCSE
jgi:hypothetical protein